MTESTGHKMGALDLSTEDEALRLAFADPYLQKQSLLGENLIERMERFGLIVENANGNWDLSDRDENALRTANALLVLYKAQLASLGVGQPQAPLKRKNP